MRKSHGDASQHQELSPQLSELRLVLLGKQGAGKTAAGNAIFGKEEFCGKEGVSCVKRQAEVAGRHVTIIDTPGWDSPSEQVKQEMTRSVSLCPPGPHAFLLTVPLEELPQKERKSMKTHLQLLGERVWRHTLLLFTCEEEFESTTIKEHIRKEKSLQWLVEQCGYRYQVLNITEECARTQVTELFGKIEEMVAGNCGDFYLPQVYHNLIESRMPKEYSEMRQEYDQKVQQLKNNWRKKEEEYKKKIEELSKSEAEIKQPIRQRSGSLNLPPHMSGEKAEEEEGGRHRMNMEAIRQGYREEALALVQHYVKPALVILVAIMGALLGSVVGANRGTFGAAIGVPIGVFVALLIAALLRNEARAARGTPPSVDTCSNQSQADPLQQIPSTAHS
ncbi:hypothetical protein SKAU_G00031780 [Synaphobranchus kaupii]|uniref:AIG1-type G domain-containing protein n=1 Tax=Synaphobranchus kaupii TaxID=118154 RepID=A0A9Q1GDZ3_SYNKA|nr:hypothetical protein SKAU_G00031780 [Synaphobranchus kaupii]